MTSFSATVSETLLATDAPHPLYYLNTDHVVYACSADGSVIIDKTAVYFPGSPGSSAIALTTDLSATQSYTSGVSADGSTIVGGWKSSTTHYISTWAIPANTRTDVYNTTSGSPVSTTCSDDASVIILTDSSTGGISWLVGGSVVTAASSGTIAPSSAMTPRVSADNTKVYGISADSGNTDKYLTTWNVSDGSIASSVLAALYPSATLNTFAKASRDGTLYIGQATAGTLFAAIWKTSDGSVSLLPQSSATYGIYEAWDISADNSLICGDGDDDTPFVWEWNGSSYDLVLLPNDWQEYANQAVKEFSQVLVISGDGTKAIGYSTDSSDSAGMAVWQNFGSAALPSATVNGPATYSVSISETVSTADTLGQSATFMETITEYGSLPRWLYR